MYSHDSHEPKKQDQIQIKTGTGLTLAVYKNIDETHLSDVVLAKNSDQSLLPGVSGFPIRPSRRPNFGPKINPSVYRVPPRLVDHTQRQAGNDINQENPKKPDKAGTPQYENINISPSQSSSNDQKLEITHGEHIRDEKKVSDELDECAMYDRRLSDGSILEDLQVRRKFKHAREFGILGNANRKNFELFKDQIVKHMEDPKTIIKEGTYKKTIKVSHYLNEETGLNVMINKNDKTFFSAWRLKDKQLENVKNRGAL